MEKDKKLNTIQDQQTDQNEIISVSSMESNEDVIQAQEEQSVQNASTQVKQTSENEQQEISIEKVEEIPFLNQNNQQFKQLSYDEAKQFQQELLKAYFIQKSRSGVKKDFQNKQTNTEIQKNISQSHFLNNKLFIGIIIATVIISLMFIGILLVKNNEYQQLISQKEQELHNLSLSHQNSFVEIQTKYNKTLKQNKLLKDLAEKAVNEEKRNCNLFDVFGLIKNTLYSKQHQNIMDFCRIYFDYQYIDNFEKQNSKNESEDSDRQDQNSQNSYENNDKDEFQNQSNETNQQKKQQQQNNDDQYKSSNYQQHQQQQQQQQQSQQQDKNQDTNQDWEIFDDILEDSDRIQQSQETNDEDKLNNKNSNTKDQEDDQEQQQNTNSNSYFKNIKDVFSESYEKAKKASNYSYQKAKQYYGDTKEKIKNVFNQNEQEEQPNWRYQQQQDNNESKFDHEENYGYNFKDTFQKTYQKVKQASSNFDGVFIYDSYSKAKQYSQDAYQKLKNIFNYNDANNSNQKEQ
ncbi:hypothetical protein ABPG74_021423 [Tetrahymena malaccensis]